MKTYLIYIFCLLCSFQLTAQTSTYFLIEKTETSGTIRLKPKDLVLPKIERPYKNEYEIVNGEELTQKCDLLIQKTFKVIDPEDGYILKNVNFVAFFDNQFKWVYYEYSFPKEHADELLKKEKLLYDFAQKFRQINIRPYIKPYDKDLFKMANFGFWDLERKYKKMILP